MKYIKFNANAGFCGTDAEEYVAFSDDIQQCVIECYLEDFVRENGEMYENIETDYGIYEDDYDDIDEYNMDYNEALDEYYENCEGSWAEVSEEEWRENNGRIY